VGIVFEVCVRQVSLVDARRGELSHSLIREIGLAGAAHADDDARLARVAGTLTKRGLPSGMGDSWNSDTRKSAAIMEHD
jgi:hypothetical protein